MGRVDAPASLRSRGGRGTGLGKPQLVNARNFVAASRDSGYKSTSQAVAELVDNSVQAGAKSIAVDVVASGDDAFPIELMVTDDGAGMDAATLTFALTFGGSTRFGDRSSLGRYGMGLPNGALSRARRVEVLTWRHGEALAARLDVDEVIVAGQPTLPAIELISPASFRPRTRHGTRIRLRRCDRLEYRRVSALVNKLHADLGRIYRRFIARGLDLRVNDRGVVALDPLMLERSRNGARARLFGNPLTYRLDGLYGSGMVEVRFSELPLERWHRLSSEEKRTFGVTNVPCVSIMRADREIDQGWYFMGGKRRENYDDWWRCEISFDPALDELFGLTHAKQSISPSNQLLGVLSPDLEPIARALNGRVRRRFELVKVTTPLGVAERQATRAESALPPIPRHREGTPSDLRELLLEYAGPAQEPEGPYQIVVADLPTTAAFEVVVHRRKLLLFLNARHPLYRDLYGPLATSDSEEERDLAKRVALLILAAARAEVAATRRAGRDEVRRFRQTWADVLATFYNA